jgi:hypothetical protein
MAAAPLSSAEGVDEDEAEEGEGKGHEEEEGDKATEEKSNSEDSKDSSEIVRKKATKVPFVNFLIIPP